MGDYATTDNFRARTDTFGATPDYIADLTRTTDTSRQNTYMDEAIDRAEGTVNAYLSRRYTVPVTGDTGFLQEITLALAEYELFKRAMGNDVPIKYKNTRDEAIEILTQISEGVVIPPGATAKSDSSSIDLDYDTARMDETSLSKF